MIGAVTYELTAESSGTLEGFAGRLLHAAFFKHLAGYSKEMSEEIHDQEISKPFAISPLIRPHGTTNDGTSSMVIEKYTVRIATGDRYFWRVSALRDDVLDAALSLRTGGTIQLGHISFAVTNVFVDGHHSSGIIDPEELIAQTLSVPLPAEISLHFLSPVSFRRDGLDYPLPAPELVFSSIADKWQQAGLPAAISKDGVREITMHVAPSDWKGRTVRTYFNRNRGTSGFIGHATYNLRAIEEQPRRILLLLAQFATFSGVGRLSAQGFGQARTTIGYERPATKRPLARHRK